MCGCEGGETVLPCIGSEIHRTLEACGEDWTAWISGGRQVEIWGVSWG